MKENRKTYPFIKKEDQTPIYTITPLCQEAIEKDGYAFFKLMEHIKEKDQGHQTVIMVQVENELVVYQQIEIIVKKRMLCLLKKYLLICKH